VTALGVVVLLFAACLGAGAAVLASARVLGDFRRGEAVAWSFAAGFRVVGSMGSEFGVMLAGSCLALPFGAGS